MSLRAAQVRIYVDADILGLGKILASLRNDVTYPGDPGADIHKRHRPSFEKLRALDYPVHAARGSDDPPFRHHDVGQLRSGDGPLSVRVRPSSLKRNCDRRTTSTGEKSEAGTGSSECWRFSSLPVRASDVAVPVAAPAGGAAVGLETRCASTGIYRRGIPPAVGAGGHNEA